MIPDEQTILKLWDTYALPDVKRNHSRLVACVSLYLAKHVQEVMCVSINMALLYAGAMLHDIDKNIPKQQNEHHPDTGVRVLQEHGLYEVANLIKTHSLPSILNQTIAPKTWEEMLLYLSDKMVKHTVITVDERFKLWREDDLPVRAKQELMRAYPKVKALEKKVFDCIGISPNDVSFLVKKSNNDA